MADVWSCGVMLYIMLAAAYPFGRPEDEKLTPSARMHAMLQVCPACGLPPLLCHNKAPPVRTSCPASSHA